MSTSDLGDDAVAGTRATPPSGLTATPLPIPMSTSLSPPSSAPTSSPDGAAGLYLPPPAGGADLSAEISRLANALFAQWPASASPVASDTVTAPGAFGPVNGMAPAFASSPTMAPPPSPFAPSVPPAMNFRLPGSPGVSPFAPPTLPGFPQTLPVGSSPFAKETDLRSIPVNVEDHAPMPFPLPLSLVGEPTAPSGVSHYFLDLAGHPAVPAPGPAAVPGPAARTATATSVAPGAFAAGAAAPRLDEAAGDVVPARPSPGGIFDPYTIKRDFPILQERVKGRPLVWLDNAATTQKPHAVIDRLSYFYAHENSNIHRAAHTLAARATDAYEAARDKVRRFLNAPSAKDIVFVRGATEAINLVAQSWGRRHVQAGDEIVISWLEHHANIVPWQLLAAEKGARLRVAPVDDRGQIILEAYEKLLGPRTRIVSLSQVSNALGTIVPVAEMIAMARRHGARVLIDGAQAVSHLRVDVQALDCDFYCFSGHKVFAPTGIGALFGKQEVLETMPPWQGGGNMIADVTFEKTVYNPPPGRFEAGTGNIADAVGLGAALDYVSALGLENIGRYEHELLEYGTHRLAEVPGLHLIGTAAEKAGVLSFVLDGVRTEEVGGMLDQDGIAVRSGHHCAQPILRRFGVESTVRASLAPYNTREDIDALASALQRLQVGRPRR